jgi:hypothetical protein
MSSDGGKVRVTRPGTRPAAGALDRVTACTAHQEGNGALY